MSFKYGIVGMLLGGLIGYLFYLTYVGPFFVQNQYLCNLPYIGSYICGFSNLILVFGTVILGGLVGLFIGSLFGSSGGSTTNG